MLMFNKSNYYWWSLYFSQCACHVGIHSRIHCIFNLGFNYGIFPTLVCVLPTLGIYSEMTFAFGFVRSPESWHFELWDCPSEFKFKK